MTNFFDIDIFLIALISKQFALQCKTHFLMNRMKVHKSQIKKNIIPDLIFEHKSFTIWPLSSKLHHNVC